MNELIREVSLASASPRRKQLLESLGLRVVVVASAFTENDYVDGDPRDYARHLAAAKAAGAGNGGPPIVVAADTLVVVGGAVFGKPRTADQAKVMLRTLAGREHTVHTGYAVRDRASNVTESGVESAQVSFLPLDDDAITRYVASGEPMDKAGAYGIQGLGSLLVAGIAGDFYTVMGLPLARIGTTLARLGYRVF
jgi:septum formation protein